ncbi:MAG: XRE family transcriptional regulator [Gemmatimonadetes bacterium]|nr:XRE family transcriptional regulator [Gemmatimonadota bacterium]
MAIASHRGSGNIFEDVGFPPEEAAHLLIRADLMLEIRTIIEERGLTQKQAAEVLGVTQPRISDLMRKKIDRFGIDTLVEMLSRLGVTVTLRMRRTAKIA